jgi:hypothetical protein
MTGLFLIAVGLGWLGICIWLTGTIPDRLPNKWRPAATLLIFALLLPLPLLDEIVGSRQFAELCKRNDTVQVDRGRAKGKIVYLLDQSDTWVEGVALPIRSQKWTFVDSTTREPVVEWKQLYATGGVLIRTLQISEGNVPLTFKGSCAPGGLVDTVRLFHQLGVIQVQRSTIDKGEQQ